ncbi:hypothetical protein ACSSS7_005668 [Eimeria intestinalis]
MCLGSVVSPQNPTSAAPLFLLIFYAELKQSHGLVLLKGDSLSAAVGPRESQHLTQVLLASYTDANKYDFVVSTQGGAAKLFSGGPSDKPHATSTAALAFTLFVCSQKERLSLETQYIRLSSACKEGLLRSRRQESGASHSLRLSARLHCALPPVDYSSSFLLFEKRSHCRRAARGGCLLTAGMASLGPLGSAAPGSLTANDKGGDPQASEGTETSRLPPPDPSKKTSNALKTPLGRVGGWGPSIPRFGGVTLPPSPHKSQASSSRQLPSNSHRKPATPSYPGGPPPLPVPRPKPTCSGLAEALEESQAAPAYLHWAEGDGLHVHVGQASWNWEDEEGFLRQRDKRQGCDQWTTNSCRRGSTPSAVSRHRRGGPCIPVFGSGEKCCAKSETVIRAHRRQRLRELWGKLDVGKEGVADMLALRAVAPSLDMPERLFLNAVIPVLVQQAISKTSRDASLEGLSLGPKHDEQLRLSALKPDTEGPVTIATLPPSSRPPRFPQERGTVEETAEQQQEQQEQQERKAAALYKRLAREQMKIVMLDGDPSTADASATPHLYVPKRLFISTCMCLLAAPPGPEGVDQFRDTIAYSCRKLVATIDPEAAKKIPKPHVLAFSRKLELQRQQEVQEQQELQQQQQDRQRSRSVPACGDLGCCVEVQQQLKGRKWSRFDAVIARYLRKRQQQQHIAQALQDLKEGQVCTFHPEINPTPRYLRRAPSAVRGRRARPPLMEESKKQQVRGTQQTQPLPTDPMVILQRFCSRYVADDRCSELVKALEECSFQPNAHKYVKQERARQQQQQQTRGNLSERIKQQEKTADCCGDEEGATAAAVDRIFKMLDSPFDAVFQADIRQWLEQEDEDGTRGSNEDSCSAKLQRQAKLAAAAPKKWVIDGREPQHRDRRACTRVSTCLLEEKGKTVVALDSPAAATAAAGAAVHANAEAAYRSRSTGGTPRNVPASSRITNPSQRWKEGLRGGYLLPNMNFSLEAQEDREKQMRREAVKKEDWCRWIRMCARGLEARALPSEDTLKSLCDEFAMPPAKPPPTLWEHRRQRRPCLDRGLDVPTYTAAAAGRAACSSSLSLSHCCEQQAAVPTVFAVPTPPKPLALRDSYQLYTQLAREAEAGALKLPPKIVGVKRDKVSYLEQQLAKLRTPLIVCADTPN